MIMLSDSSLVKRNTTKGRWFGGGTTKEVKKLVLRKKDRGGTQILYDMHGIFWRHGNNE